MNESDVNSKKYKREEECRKIFEGIFNCKFESVRPDFLKNPRTNHNLELDGFSFNYLLGFEHQGKQHYHYPNTYHKSEKEFLYQLQKDKYKKQKCKELGIDLVIIPYSVPFHKLSVFIIDKLKCIGFTIK
jgi:hypothetical protein